ncbi:MAG: hypothetical protein ACOY90_13135 [Candidatus Zhuqueibacterota bacterium]
MELASDAPGLGWNPLKPLRCRRLFHREFSVVDDFEIAPALVHFGVRWSLPGRRRRCSQLRRMFVHLKMKEKEWPKK